MSEEAKKDNAANGNSKMESEQSSEKENSLEKFSEDSKENPTSEPPKGKKKKIYKIISVTLAVILILLIILSFTLGIIIKGAVNHVLPTMTGTPSGMGSCYLNVFTGTLNIKDFIIGNPEGYKTPQAFKLGEIHVDLGVTSLLSDKIVIEEIIVDNMEVSFETKFSGSKLPETNIGVIKDNIDKATKKEETVETTEKEEPSEGSGSRKKLQINKFTFKNSKIYLHAGVGTSIPLPEIKFKDLGAESEDGITVAEITEKVSSKLYSAIFEQVQSAGGLDTEDLKKGAGKVLGNVNKGLKDLLGGKKE